MRTTLNLQDDALRAARSLAHSRSISLGDAISELILKALRSAPSTDYEDGIPVFRVPADAAPITMEDVQRAEAELW